MTANQERVDMADYLLLVWKKRSVVILTTLLGMGIGIGLALLQKPVWVSTATLLPTESKADAGAFAGLAALAGIGMPQASSPETFYRDILLSPDFLDTLIWIPWKTAEPGSSKTLAELYQLKADSASPGGRERFRQRMIKFIRKKKLVDFERDASGLMTLTCETIDPEVSHGICAVMLERLDDYNRVKKKTRTTEKKALIEQRLGDVEANLRQSEEKLRNFREKNLSVSTPSLLLEQQRLMRELEVNGALYQELRKQYEITKIEVVDNTEFLNVLGKPMVPTIDAKSTRRKTALISTLLGLFAGAAGVLLFAKLSALRLGNAA